MQEEEDLTFRLQCFVYDMLNLHERIQTSVAQYYMDEFYFSPEEVLYLLQHPTNDGRTFEELIQEKVAGRMELCSSHHLAPLFYETFGIRKDFHKSKAFKRRQREWLQRKQQLL